MFLSLSIYIIWIIGKNSTEVLIRLKNISPKTVYHTYIQMFIHSLLCMYMCVWVWYNISQERFIWNVCQIIWGLTVWNTPRPLHGHALQPARTASHPAHWELNDCGRNTCALAAVRSRSSSRPRPSHPWHPCRLVFAAYRRSPWTKPPQPPRGPPGLATAPADPRGPTTRRDPTQGPGLPPQRHHTASLCDKTKSLTVTANRHFVRGLLMINKPMAVVRKGPGDTREEDRRQGMAMAQWWRIWFWTLEKKHTLFYENSPIMKTK